MANAYGTYTGEEVYINFSATISEDYDGAGAPVTDVDNVEIETLIILEVTITDAEFAAFPAALQEAIRALHAEVEFEGDASDDGDYAYEQSRDE